MPPLWNHHQRRLHSSDFNYNRPWYYQAAINRAEKRNDNGSALTYFSSDRLTTTKCEEPNDLSQRLTEWSHESHKRSTTSSHQSHRSQSDDTVDERQVQNAKNSVHIFTSVMAEPPVCRQQPSTNPNSDIMARALCPWEWQLNRDDNREPKIISEARCLCRRSRGLMAADCIQIKRDFPVLKRVECDDSSGRYQYQKAYQTITVGCHSVMPRTRRAASYEILTKFTDV